MLLRYRSRHRSSRIGPEPLHSTAAFSSPMNSLARSGPWISLLVTSTRTTSPIVFNRRCLNVSAAITGPLSRNRRRMRYPGRSGPRHPGKFSGRTEPPGSLVTLLETPHRDGRRMPMASIRRGAALRQIQALYRAGTCSGLTDGQLLDRYLTGPGERAEMAFAALIERHGSMVLRVCRAVLRDEHDAEDAFQATFLVLARRAGSIRSRGSLASWLFGVATRVARCARSTAARRTAARAEAGGDDDGGCRRCDRGRPRSRDPSGDRSIAGEAPRGGRPVLLRGPDLRAGGRTAGPAGRDDQEPAVGALGPGCGPGWLGAAMRPRWRRWPPGRSPDRCWSRPGWRGDGRIRHGNRRGSGARGLAASTSSRPLPMVPSRPCQLPDRRRAAVVLSVSIALAWMAVATDAGGLGPVDIRPSLSAVSPLGPGR